jgi:hypothetical protein
MLWSVFVTLWLLVLPAVAAAETRTDINRSKDFSRYKTYAVEVNPPIRYGEVDADNTITEDRFRRAVEYELRLHGLTLATTSPDLVVRVSHREDERTELISTGPGYPWGWYGPWGYGYGGYWGAPYWGDVWTYRYLEGTTRIDVIESATGDLVYRGEVEKKVDDDEEDLNRDALKIAHKAFKKFPVRGVLVDD